MTPTIVAAIPPTTVPALMPLEATAAPVALGCVLVVDEMVSTEVVVNTGASAADWS